MYRINNDLWIIKYVHPGSDKLRRSDGSLTIGMTNGNNRTVYIAANLSDQLREKVIAHELVHCFMFSYNIDLDIDEEEFIADWVATYGRELVNLLDDILYSIKTA